MKVKKIVGGPLPTNCYLLTDETAGVSAVVDPGFESPELDDALRAAGDVRAVLLTHAHFDHITGVHRAVELTGAKVYLYSEDLPLVSSSVQNVSSIFLASSVPPFHVDTLLNDGDVIPLGNLKIRVIHTPGHTAGGCCYLAGDALFSGDTLMRLDCGRTDLPTGSEAQMRASLRRLAALPGDPHVYPGHGPETTLEYERRNSPEMNFADDDADS